MNQKIITFIFAALAVIMPIHTDAQEFTWSVDFKTVFDNREGDNKITPTKTYIFTNLAPEIGVKFGKYGRVSGGVVWNQPIGCEWNGYRISPTLYYRYESANWNFSMGMFPRHQLREELPNFLWSDSLTYYQNNIRGVLAQYHSKKGFVDFYLDWRALQTEQQREAFNIVVHGQWKHSWFRLGGHAMMNHFAKRKNAPADEYVVDNFLVNPYIGANFDKKTALKKLNFRLGLLANIERNRALGDGWTTSYGGWLEANAEWRFLGLKNTLYLGKRLLPSYAQFGSKLYPGEPFYQEKFYNRTDVYAHIFNNKYVDLEASLDFNFTPGSFIFYQRLQLRVYLNSQKLPFKKRNKHHGKH